MVAAARSCVSSAPASRNRSTSATSPSATPRAGWSRPWATRAGRVFARSCMKPLQAAVSLAAIGDVRLSDREIAVMCSSHNAEPVHLGAVRAILRRAGLGPVGACRRRRRGRSTSRRWRGPSTATRSSTTARASTPACCSRASGRGGTRRRTCAGRIRCSEGCTAPCSERPDVEDVDGRRRRLRRARARGAAAPPWPRCTRGSPRPSGIGPVAEQADRAIEAMLAEPYLVGGRDRVDTAVMQATGDVVAKEGAEALDCAAVLSSGLGVAVKVADGWCRAAGPALLHALAQVDGARSVAPRGAGRAGAPGRSWAADERRRARRAGVRTCGAR